MVNTHNILSGVPIVRCNAVMSAVKRIQSIVLSIQKDYSRPDCGDEACWDMDWKVLLDNQLVLEIGFGIC